jgi:aldehyde:ferredoxin oxidoreductase
VSSSYSNEYPGRILDIDLTSGKTTVRPLPYDLLKNFIGGAGINARILYDEVPPSCDPLSEENLLILGFGPLVGSDFPASTRFTITSKSPLTGIYTDSNAGGGFGGAARKKGYDHIIIRGKSDKPVYLLLGKDGDVKILDARDVWGLDIFQADEKLRKVHGRCETLRIGPAGENLVKFATIVSSSGRISFNGRGGLGCVMGAKNLKAIVVAEDDQEAGTHSSLPLAHADALKELSVRYRKLMRESERCKVRSKCGTMDIMGAYSAFDDLWEKNYQDHLDSSAVEDLLPPSLLTKYMAGKTGCPGCPLSCTLKFKIGEGAFSGEEGNKFEFGHAYLLGPNLGIYTFPPLLHLANAANRLGMDSMELGSTLGMITECVEQKLITSRDGEGLNVKWGDVTGYSQLIEKIAFRQGIGDTLAEGVRKSSAAISPRAQEFAFHVKGQGYRIDSNQAWMLSYVLSPRGADHLKGMPFTMFAPGRKDIIDRFIGSLPGEGGYDPRSPEGKGRVVWWHENFKTLIDCLGVCIFPVVGLFSEGHLPLETVAELYNSATGLDLSARDLFLSAERVYQLQKAFNVKLGITRKDDYFIKSTANGREGKDLPFKKIDLDHPGMLEEYYRYRGYSSNGLPSPNRLKEVGLTREAQELAHANLVGDDAALPMDEIMKL